MAVIPLRGLSFVLVVVSRVFESCCPCAEVPATVQAAATMSGLIGAPQAIVLGSVLI